MWILFRAHNVKLIMDYLLLLLRLYCNIKCYFIIFKLYLLVEKVYQKLWILLSLYLYFYFVLYKSKIEIMKCFGHVSRNVIILVKAVDSKQKPFYKVHAKCIICFPDQSQITLHLVCLD